MNSLSKGGSAGYLVHFSNLRQSRAGWPRHVIIAREWNGAFWSFHASCSWPFEKVQHICPNSIPDNDARLERGSKLKDFSTAKLLVEIMKRLQSLVQIESIKIGPKIFSRVTWQHMVTQWQDVAICHIALERKRLTNEVSAFGNPRLKPDSSALSNLFHALSKIWGWAWTEAEASARWKIS